MWHVCVHGVHIKICTGKHEFIDMRVQAMGLPLMKTGRQRRAGSGPNYLMTMPTTIPRFASSIPRQLRKSAPKTQKIITDWRKWSITPCLCEQVLFVLFENSFKVLNLFWWMMVNTCKVSSPLVTEMPNAGVTDFFGLRWWALVQNSKGSPWILLRGRQRLSRASRPNGPWIET